MCTVLLECGGGGKRSVWTFYFQFPIPPCWLPSFLYLHFFKMSYNTAQFLLISLISNHMYLNLKMLFPSNSHSIYFWFLLLFFQVLTNLPPTPPPTFQPFLQSPLHLCLEIIATPHTKTLKRRMRMMTMRRRRRSLLDTVMQTDTMMQKCSSQMHI